MLELFTDLGLLMHFNRPGLRDLVVLKNHWLLNNMRNLLCLRHLEGMVGEAKEGSEKRALMRLKSELDVGAARLALLSLRDTGLLEPAAALPPSIYRLPPPRPCNVRVY